MVAVGDAAPRRVVLVEDVGIVDEADVELDGGGERLAIDAPVDVVSNNAVGGRVGVGPVGSKSQVEGGRDVVKNGGDGGGGVEGFVDGEEVDVVDIDGSRRRRRRRAPTRRRAR